MPSNTDTDRFTVTRGELTTYRSACEIASAKLRDEGIKDLAEYCEKAASEIDAILQRQGQGEERDELRAKLDAIRVLAEDGLGCQIMPEDLVPLLAEMCGVREQK